MKFYQPIFSLSAAVVTVSAILGCNTTQYQRVRCGMDRDDAVAMYDSIRPTLNAIESYMLAHTSLSNIALNRENPYAVKVGLANGQQTEQFFVGTTQKIRSEDITMMDSVGVALDDVLEIQGLLKSIGAYNVYNWYHLNDARVRRLAVSFRISHPTEIRMCDITFIRDYLAFRPYDPVVTQGNFVIAGWGVLVSR